MATQGTGAIGQMRPIPAGQTGKLHISDATAHCQRCQVALDNQCDPEPDELIGEYGGYFLPLFDWDTAATFEDCP